MFLRRHISQVSQLYDGSYFLPDLRAAAASPRSIMSVWDQLVAIIPYPDLVSWFLEMYVTNQAMVDFVSKLQESKEQFNVGFYLKTPKVSR